MVDAGEAPVAFMAARVAGERLHIEELDVQDGQHGKGLGKRLLQHAADWAKANGLIRLSLTTFRGIPWNAPYYARFGFRQDLTSGLWLPGPVDRKRFLARELTPGALDKAEGPVLALAA